MTINPDTPISSEQYLELYERMCNAKAFIEQVLAAYVKARKANGMTRPKAYDLDLIQGELENTIDDEFTISDERCVAQLGERFIMYEQELEKLIEENWNGSN